MIAESDQTGTNPERDRLKELFNRYAPCLILIDEWVAYARQLHHDLNLPCRTTFDTQFTFAQSLSESAKAADHCLLVVSIPASDNEIGGELGLDAVNRMQNAIGRVESSWRPASPDEGFEIVGRRLFEPIDPGKIQVPGMWSAGVSDYYKSQPQEFPRHCSDGEYEQRLKLAPLILHLNCSIVCSKIGDLWTAFNEQGGTPSDGRCDPHPLGAARIPT